LSGLLVIAGGVITALIGMLSAKRSDGRKNEFESKRILDQREREDLQRWDRDLMEKSATFAQACFTLSTACERRLNRLAVHSAVVGRPDCCAMA